MIPAIRFEEVSHRSIPCIGLYYLASYIEKYEPETRVKVFKTPEEVIKAKPDIIGISAVTENMSVAIDWAGKIREKTGAPILLGGNHISALPHMLPEIFDVGIIGEGEETLLELVKLIKNEPDWRKKLPEVVGICFHQGGEVEITPQRPLIEPIEKIPYPRRDAGLWGTFHYMFTSRGCPYHCTFCSPCKIWRRYRAFPAKYVIGEMNSIFRNFIPSYIHFFDDLFIGDRERIKKLSKMVRKRGFHRAVSFGGHIRANLIDDEICMDLRRMNFVSGAFGAETGSDKILKFLKTGSTTVEMNQKAIDTCIKHGIQINPSFIIGTPGETAEDLDKTIEFIEKNRKKLAAIEIFIAMPYPGTPLWTMCKRRGLVSDDMDWDLFRTKAFFSEFELADNFLYVNEAMERDVFREYVRKFQKLDAEINRTNVEIFDLIERDAAAVNKLSGPGMTKLKEKNAK